MTLLGVYSLVQRSAASSERGPPTRVNAMASGYVMWADGRNRSGRTLTMHRAAMPRIRAGVPPPGRLTALRRAAAGTFGGLLLRPQGAHPEWGVQAGLGVQLLGLIQCGYVLQAVSVRNIAVVAVATGCNARRAICEERVLAGRSGYAAYRRRVRRRLLPGVW